MPQSPKILTRIELFDNRGTGISLQLYLQKEICPDYQNELKSVWLEQFGGNADQVRVTLNVEPVQFPLPVGKSQPQSVFRIDVHHERYLSEIP